VMKGQPFERILSSGRTAGSQRFRWRMLGILLADLAATYSPAP